MTGRPSSFTQEVADAICEGLASGKSLRSVCSLPDMPSKTTVLKWLRDPAREAFVAQYASAREMQADSYFDDIIDIADDSSHDFKTVTRKDGTEEEVFDTEHYQRSKLRIDSRKYIAAQLRPKVYGEKTTVDVGNKDDKPFKQEQTGPSLADLAIAMAERMRASKAAE